MNSFSQLASPLICLDIFWTKAIYYHTTHTSCWSRYLDRAIHI